VLRLGDQYATTTNALGEFHFDSIREGPYALRLDEATLPPNSHIMGEASREIVLTSPETARANFDFEMRKPEPRIRVIELSRDR
jgi:protocatechuate 3,4-dioxygenase beta subunit